MVLVLAFSDEKGFRSQFRLVERCGRVAAAQAHELCHEKLTRSAHAYSRNNSLRCQGSHNKQRDFPNCKSRFALRERGGRGTELVGSSGHHHLCCRQTFLPFSACGCSAFSLASRANANTTSVCWRIASFITCVCTFSTVAVEQLRHTFVC